MMQQAFSSDMIESLLQRINYLERRLNTSDTFDGSSAITHGGLDGLDNDDHTQYLTVGRHDLLERHGTASVDHGSVAGLADDDHSQYHNDARGDARYYTQTQLQTSGSASVHWNNVTNKTGILSEGDVVLRNGWAVSTGGYTGQHAYGGTAANQTFVIGGNSGAGTSTPGSVAISFRAQPTGDSAYEFGRLRYSGVWEFPLNIVTPAATGGTAASNNLTLESTSHATKGNVIIQPNGGNVGIGAAPTVGMFEVRRDQVAATVLAINNDANSIGAFSRLAFYDGATECARHQWNNATGSQNFFVTTIGSFPLYLGTNDIIALTIDTSQRVGIGTSSPQGRLHGHDGTGGFLFVTKTGVAGTAVTIIPDGTGDVVRLCWVRGIMWDGVVATAIEVTNPTSVVAPGGTLVCSGDGGTNTITFTCSAGGALTVARTAGSRTWTVMLWLTWL